MFPDCHMLSGSDFHLIPLVELEFLIFILWLSGYVSKGLGIYAI